MGDGHELRVERPPKQCVIGAQEGHHFKGEDLLTKIGRFPKCGRELDAPEGHGLHLWYDPIEGRFAWMKASSWDPHAVQGVGVEDVNLLSPSMSTLESWARPTIAKQPGLGTWPG